MLNEKLWIWGHPANSLINHFGIKQESHVTPVEGMKELGAKNVFYVPMGRPTVREDESALMQKECNSFGWSLENNAGQVDQLLEMKKNNSRLRIGVFDDFFNDDNPGNNMEAHKIEDLLATKKRLNDAGMEMWAVYYERFIEYDISPYLDCFDGFSFWFWRQPTNEDFETILKRFYEKTPGKKRMIGCYLYDFGREGACGADSVLYQLRRDTEMIREGLCEGIILHTNAVSHMGLEAYDAAIQWVKEHGAEEV